jgi:hypothetical protein
VVLKTAPFEEDSDDVISFVTEVQLSVTMFCGFALLTDSTESPKFDAGNMDIFLVAINCFGFLALLVCNLRQGQEQIVQVAKVVRAKSRRMSLVGLPGLAGLNMQPAGKSADRNKKVVKEEEKEEEESNVHEPHQSRATVVPEDRGESRVRIRPLSEKFDFPNRK